MSQILSEPGDLLLRGKQLAYRKRQTVPFILENQQFNRCFPCLDRVTELTYKLDGQEIIRALYQQQRCPDRVCVEQGRILPVLFRLICWQSPFIKRDKVWVEFPVVDHIHDGALGDSRSIEFR